MRRAILLFSTIAAFIAIADGMAMILPGPSSKISGFALLCAGVVWLFAGAPRFLKPEAQPFAYIVLANLGLLLIPVLFLPVCGLWLIATPSALTVWFSVAWASLWFACLALAFLIPCPECGQRLRGIRISQRLRSPRCLNCGASPRVAAGQNRN